MNRLTKADMDALVRAVEIACQDQKERERIEARLAAGRNWTDVAIACAFSLQHKSLELKPWENPPCCGDIDRPRLDQHA
jgi:hypothetical protein